MSIFDNGHLEAGWEIDEIKGDDRLQPCLQHRAEPNGEGLLIDPHGDLAGILSIASKSGKQLKPEELSFVQESGAQKSLGPAFSRPGQVRLVAGAPAHRKKNRFKLLV